MSDTNSRIVYDTTPYNSINVVRGDQNMELPVEKILADEALATHLAKAGLVDYLRRQAGAATPENKLDAIEKAYDNVMENGMDAFKRKQRTRGPVKAEKVAALAALEGATTNAIEEALTYLSKKDQHEMLNSEKVLNKLESMKRSDVQLSL